MSMRAVYAADPKQSRGRLFSEPESETRTVFQRDRDRIIHSAAFRRLKHKTQVFVYHEGDYYRTRLTHSLEVAQIARSIARVLMLDEDLSEALALAHDLGHPPFGHAGEDALKACMAGFEGFDHNAHSLRLVTFLEQRYAQFDGLNLTWETLEGVVKHNGPLSGPYANVKARSKPLPVAIVEYMPRHDLELHTFASAEAQVAAISDDIAYNNHDIDDGLRAGLFQIAELTEAVPFVGRVFDSIARAYPGIQTQRLIHESIRRLISAMVDDVIAETHRRATSFDPRSSAGVRAMPQALVGFSPAMEENDRVLKSFLFKRMYRHYRVNRMMMKAKRVIEELFGLFLEEPQTLPPEWSCQAGASRSPQTARTVCDYIAGMTDRFALQEHRRLFNLDAQD